MTTQLAPTPIFKAFDNVGLPLAFGKLYTYQAGTTTPQATYTDSTGNTPNPNPITLNARGETPLWLNPTLNYKFALTDASGNQIPGWPVDNINGSLYPGNSIIPNTSNAFTLGSPQFSWANAYFGPNAIPVFDTGSGAIGYWPPTAAEIAAGVTPANYAYEAYNLLRYGADPTGATPCDTAFNNAITVLAQVPGGTLTIPTGIYTFATANTALNSKSGIVIKGAGSPSSGIQPGTRFQFTGTGAVVWFALNGAQGVQFRGIQFVHTQASFTGTYLQCNNNGLDPANCGIYDCVLGASVSAVLHLDLNKCINFSCERTTFQYFGSSGSVRGAQVSGYANNIAFRSCEWFNGVAAPIQNSGPHQAWAFSSCTFEGLSQTTNTPAGAILSTASSGTWAALSMDACWLGDAGTATGAWIDAYIQGASFTANYISGNATGTTAFNLRQSSGVSFRGNFLDTLLNGINFATSPCTDITVCGNLATGVINRWANSANCLIGTLDWASNNGFGVPPGHGSPVANNGYRVFPDGTGGTAQGEIDMWGSSTVVSATGTITISGATGLAFPNACTNVVGNISASANANGLYLTPSGVNFTYAITGSMPASVTFSWQAKGN